MRYCTLSMRLQASPYMACTRSPQVFRQGQAAAVRRRAHSAGRMHAPKQRTAHAHAAQARSLAKAARTQRGTHVHAHTAASHGTHVQALEQRAAQPQPGCLLADHSGGQLQVVACTRTVDHMTSYKPYHYVIQII